MTDLATVTDLGTLRGQRRHAHDLTRPQRSPRPVSCCDGSLCAQVTAIHTAMPSLAPTTRSPR